MLVYRVRLLCDGSVRSSNLHRVNSISESMSEDRKHKHIPEVVKARMTMLRMAKRDSDRNETTEVEGIGKFYWDTDKEYGDVFRIIVQEGEF